MTEYFLSCDWGTSHFRMRAATAANCQIAAQWSSDAGVALLAEEASGSARADSYRRVLQGALAQVQTKLAGLEEAPICISGMASSSIGWQELPYAVAPQSLGGEGLNWREIEPVTGPGGTHRTLLISGLRTQSDVMRGEETQTLGVFELPQAKNLAERALVILPGTHSKHVRISAGRIEDFRTFMTGELFDVLSRHSVLRHSVGGTAGDGDATSLEALYEGAALASRVPFSAALFQTRTRDVLEGRGATGRAFLSGLLIGSELAHLTQDAADLPIVLAGAAELQQPYSAVLDAFGLSQLLTVVSPFDVERLTALGQAKLLRLCGILAG